MARLTQQVAASPDDVALRLLLGGALARSQPSVALTHVLRVLQTDPTSAAALALLTTVAGRLSAPPPEPPGPDGGSFDWAAAEVDVEDVGPPGCTDLP